MNKIINEPILGEEDIQLAKKYNYEYSLIVDKVVLPTFIIPASYEFSRKLQMRKGDICITSHPKSGSTWLTYTMLLLTRQGETPKEKDLAETFWWPSWGADYMLTTEQLEAASDPRLFRSHMPYQLAVGGVPVANPCKYIYIARHPKDVVCSYYNYAQDFDTYQGPWEDFLRLFMEGKTWFGDWFDHAKGWWNQRNADNVLFLWYEDMKFDFETETRKVADFLNYPLSDELLLKIKQATTFKSMKNNDLTNMKHVDETKKAPPKKYYRKGGVDTWKEQFTETQSEQFDAWYARRMQETGLALDEAWLFNG